MSNEVEILRSALKEWLHLVTKAADDWEEQSGFDTLVLGDSYAHCLTVTHAALVDTAPNKEKPYE